MPPAMNPNASDAPAEVSDGSAAEGETVEVAGAKERQSNSICSGADTLLALFTSEQSKLTQAYVTSLKEIEDDYKQIKAQSSQAVTNAKAEVARVKAEAAQAQELANSRISALEQELRRAGERELSTLTELEALRLQNKHVLGALSAVGIEFVDGQLQFNAHAAAIVDNYVKDARKQEEELKDTKSPPPNDLQPLDPDRFFDGLKGLLNRNPEQTESIEQPPVQLQKGKKPTKTPLSPSSSPPAKHRRRRH